MRSTDQGCCTWETRIRPHVPAHEVFGLVRGIFRLREGRRGDNDGGIFGFQCEVDKLEVCVVVFGTDMLNHIHISMTEGDSV